MKATSRPFRSRRAPFPAKQVTQGRLESFRPKRRPQPVPDSRYLERSRVLLQHRLTAAWCSVFDDMVPLFRNVPLGTHVEMSREHSWPTQGTGPSGKPVQHVYGSKCVTAMLAMHLVKRGRLGLDEPVSAVLKGGCFGKEHHTQTPSPRRWQPSGSGRLVGSGYSGRSHTNHETHRECQGESEPGVEAAYHAVTGGFNHPEMIRAVTGRTPSNAETI